MRPRCADLAFVSFVLLANMSRVYVCELKGFFYIDFVIFEGLIRSRESEGPLPNLVRINSLVIGPVD